MTNDYPNTMNHPRFQWLAACLIIGLTFWLYLPTQNFEFIKYDDGDYVYDNPVVKGGLTAAGLKWAFSDVSHANWHPLTWLSLMTDVELFGMKPGPMHLVNASMHALAAGLLFLWLVQLAGGRRLDGRTVGQLDGGTVGQLDGRTVRLSDRLTAPPFSGLWLLIAAAFGALLWALHPLRVESVAWISSRKDVLSVLFCLGGLMLYLKEVRLHRLTVPPSDGSTSLTAGRPTVPLFSNAGLATCSWRWWVALGLFCLGYMAKPTMMVFPAFVALVEWWETGRVRWKPLLVYGGVAAGLLGLTIFAQTGAMYLHIDLPWRLVNATISVAAFVRQFFWPTGMAVFYPYNLPYPVGICAMGIGTVTVLAVLAVICWKRAPTITLGLVWFAAALVPVLGLIQVGSASRADRYTYLSTLGFSIIAAIGVVALLRRLGRNRLIAGMVCVALAGVCLVEGAVARDYLREWRNTVALFSHAVANTERNAMAYTTLGGCYTTIPGQEARTGWYYRAALQALRNAETLGHMATWLLLNGGPEQREEAGALGREAVLMINKAGSMDEEESCVLDAMGIYHLQRMEWPEAEVFFRQCVAQKCVEAVHWEWLAMSCFHQQKFADVRMALEQALRLDPGNQKYRTMLEQVIAKEK